MTRVAATALLLVAATSGGLVLAQRSASRGGDPGPEPAKIHLGQSLAEVTRILSERQITFVEGGFAFAQGDADQSNLLFRLDEEHTDVCAFYSKSRARITGLAMVFFPSRTDQSKASRSWVRATELFLYPDRSYAVHFAAPLTPEQLRRAEANRPPPQYPPAPPPSRGQR